MRTGHGVWLEREGLLVRVEGADGKVGYGEVSPLETFGTETQAQAQAALAELNGEVGVDMLDRLAPTHPCTAAGLRAALTEAAGTRVGSPDTAAREKDYYQVAGLLPAGRRALERGRQLADNGFRVFKWKIGVEPLADEVLLLDDLLATLPEGSRLRLDANGALDRRKAERWLERCADRPVEFLEQPVPAREKGSEDCLLGLAGDFPTPLALDEALVSEGDLRRWLDLGWPGVYVLKPQLLPDAAGSCEKLSERKATVVFSSALETAVGARAVLAAAFAWKGKRLALGMGVWPLFADGRFDGPHAAPFIRLCDLDTLNAEALWNALS